MAKRVVIVTPSTPVLPMVKLRVLLDLQRGNVVYIKDDVIEVFYVEAAQLLSEFPEFFEEATS